MKKSALIIANVCITALAFGQATRSTSLNGIDKSTATAMISHFVANKDSDKNPFTVSVWFSKEMVHNMVVLLNSELSSETPTQGTGDNSGDNDIGLTDGVRIYYASDPTVSSYPLKTSIILVSTKDSGISREAVGVCRSQRLHADYFEHASNAVLFTVNNLNGLVCNDNGNCSGASLYGTCYNCRPDEACPAFITHAIKRDDAETMVHNFRHHAINTKSEWFDLALWRAIDADTIHTGIRIYFSTNPYDAVDTNRSKRDVLVITTTKTDPVTGANVDYFDCGISAAYQKAYYARYLKGRKWAGPAQDNGELCPKNCN